MIRRPPSSTQSRSSAASDVYKGRCPDGESRLRLPAGLPDQVALLRGLQQPNQKLAELMIVAPDARELGTRQLTPATYTHLRAHETKAKHVCRLLLEKKKKKKKKKKTNRTKRRRLIWPRPQPS